MLVLGGVSLAPWLAYGVLTCMHSLPILLGNGCNLFFTPLLVHFKWRYRAAPSMAPAPSAT